MNTNQELQDAHGRAIHYIRLSVTDRCNFRCEYCHVDDSFIPHDRVIRYEEMERLVDLLVPRGIRKVRLTGGEPFVRKGFMDFLTRLRTRHPHLDLRLTTNGVYAGQNAAQLKELGVGVNLSLDSMRRERFAKITGKDELPTVLRSLDSLLKHGVALKLNAVALHGINDDELSDFLTLAKENPIDVRYIEFMPMGGETLWNKERFWSADDILKNAGEIVSLRRLVHNSQTDGPASMYAIENGLGRFGVISPLTNHYCGTCNRLRITSDGKLRTCLYDDREYFLLPVMRKFDREYGDAQLMRIIEAALLRKPIGAEILARQQKEGKAVASKAMFSIGG